MENIRFLRMKMKSNSCFIWFLVALIVVLNDSMVHAEGEQPAPAATPTPEPTPNVDDLVNQLMKATPEQLKAKFDAMKAEATKMNEDAKALRAQADALDAKSADLLKRIQIMETLLGVAPPPAEAPKAEAPAEGQPTMTADAAPAEPKPEMKPEMKPAEPAPAPPAEMAKMESKPEAAPAAPKFTFDKDIRPVMMAKCAKCHNAQQAKGGFAIDSYQKMMAGGGSGAVIAAGDPDGSRLYRLIAHKEEPAMPLGGSKLDDATLELIRTWIEIGAPENEKSAPQMAKKPDVAMAAPAAPQPVLAEGAIPMPAHFEQTALNPVEGPLPVRSIASSPTAPLIAIAGQKQVALYNAESNELLGAVPFAEGTPESLRFSPNGSLLVVAGGDPGAMGLAAVYDVVSGRRVADFGMTFDSVLTADITLDHKQVALGGANKVVQVFNTATKEMMYELKTHTDWILSTAFSPDGWFLATGDRAGGLYVWLAETGRDAFMLRAHEGAVTSLDYRADSQALASAGEDGSIRIWEMNNGGQIKSWGAHGNGALAVRWSRDGRLASCGADGRVKLWQADGKLIAEFPALNDWVYSTAFTLQDQRLVAGSWKGEIKVFEVEGAKELTTLSLIPKAPSQPVVAQVN
jgi:hypothetical protein